MSDYMDPPNMTCNDFSPAPEGPPINREWCKRCGCHMSVHKLHIRRIEDPAVGWLWGIFFAKSDPHPAYRCTNMAVVKDIFRSRKECANEKS